MDTIEDEPDIWLQRASADLIADFNQSLPEFLRKQNGIDDGSHGRVNSKLRTRVRVSETRRMAFSLLEPFQELPQLLDPHLSKFVTVLAEAYLENLVCHGRRPKILSMRNQLLMPLPTAICHLIYTFCKIRGEKIVVRFLNVETKYLELLLTAIEDAEKYLAVPSDGAPEEESGRVVPWTWEEKYVSLLWLSHLLLAPFDLSTISSVDMDDLEIPKLSGLNWPDNLPGLVFRVVPLAIKYISSPGKERDGAKAVLVRVAMRKDMQELGMLNALVRWALASLRPRKGATIETPYTYIGILSFLAGILRSSVDTADMDPYLPSIFYAVHAISPDSDDPIHRIISSSVLARKTIIKVMRSIAVILLRNAPDDRSIEIIEDTISHLLGSLADNDTPVRFAASKALSVIALKLDLEMAGEVIKAILDLLKKNVLTKTHLTDTEAIPSRDFSNVDPLEWHGLMLTLSNLLYRRSPPAEMLSEIVLALLMGLSFERKAIGGASTGTNVRDASCFGIWAMARRYTTAELLVVKVPQQMVTKHSLVRRMYSIKDSTILQVLANKLVVAASLDPAGNIRRGASAALQELIGRHPDTVTQGILVVQTVDYHAVALRSRAIRKVALKVACLDHSYNEVLLNELLGWRGIGDADPVARRFAGESFGALVHHLACIAPQMEEALECIGQAIRLILNYLADLQKRQVEERHGLLTCLSFVLDNLMPELWGRCRREGGDDALRAMSSQLLADISAIVATSQRIAFRKPELVAESSSRLIVSCFPVLQILIMCQQLRAKSKDAESAIGHPRTTITTNLVSNVTFLLNRLPSGIDQLKPENSMLLSQLTMSFKYWDTSINPLGAIEIFKKAIDEWLSRSEPNVIEQTSEAALVVLTFLYPQDRRAEINKWANAIRFRSTSNSRLNAGVGHFFALAAVRRVFPDSDVMTEQIDTLTPSSTRVRATDALLARWNSDKDIDTRIAILRSLASSGVLATEPLEFVRILEEGLDDYTTTAKGDVGSLVRLEGLRAVKSLWLPISELDGDNYTLLCVNIREVVKRLYFRVLRLAAEKLDRVRMEAQKVLALSLRTKPREYFTRTTFSSQPYFRFLLKLRWENWLHSSIANAALTGHFTSEYTKGKEKISDKEAKEESMWMSYLLLGLVTSADTGNEDLVMCSRAALVEFCNESQANLDKIACALVNNLKTCINSSSSFSPSKVSTATTKNNNNKPVDDRIIISTIEIISFLLRIGVLWRASTSPGVACLRNVTQTSVHPTVTIPPLSPSSSPPGTAAALDFRSLCTLVQRAVYKSGNVRKIEACVRLYGGIASLPQVAGLSSPSDGNDGRKREAAIEAKKRLAALLFHPWPRVRNLVVDELWSAFTHASLDIKCKDKGPTSAGVVENSNKNADMLLGVDWGQADKVSINNVIEILGIS